MIKEARKKQRLTQKELAIKCNLSQSFLSELESKHKKKKEKVDIDQVEARFWGENDILLKRYNNIENKYYNC